MVPEHPKNTGEHPWKKVQKSPKTNLEKVIGKSLGIPEKSDPKMTPCPPPEPDLKWITSRGSSLRGQKVFENSLFVFYFCFLGCKILKKRFH